MNNIKFNSLNELYNRLMPALSLKKENLSKNNIFVSELELFSYLKDTLWIYNPKLNLYDMVNDILNLDELKLNKYLNNEK